jgi:hypothetical protein
MTPNLFDGWFQRTRSSVESSLYPGDYESDQRSVCSKIVDIGIDLAIIGLGLTAATCLGTFYGFKLAAKTATSAASAVLPTVSTAATVGTTLFGIANMNSLAHEAVDAWGGESADWSRAITGHNHPPWTVYGV